MLKKVGCMMVAVYRRLRGTNKVERVAYAGTVEAADKVIEANQDSAGGWIYFRELTDDERLALSE